MIQKQQHSLLNKAEEACNLLRRHLERDHVVRIISHNDADGISAAGVMCNAIAKENGKFHVTIIPRLKDEVLSKFLKEKYKLFIFCDMGSANLKSISRLKGEVIIADHHQTDPEAKLADSIIHVNPHLYGLDGTKDVSGSGVAYLTVRSMEYKNLAGLALVGAFGDMQYKNGFSSVNKMILDDGVESGNIEVRDDLKLAYKSQEPLYKALSYTINPVIKGVSGDEEGSVTFLEKIGISYGIKFDELSNEEKDILKTELVKINPEIFSSVYSVPSEIPELRNLEDYSNILDACGKNKKQGVGLSICIGDRKNSIKEAQDPGKNLQR
jgi:single-stranded-DNA-specific exonuclease